jgi:2',3'-cyclic-nucleotide 2'-phosphodiesterase (5'-nucleotidase family)
MGRLSKHLAFSILFCFVFACSAPETRSIAEGKVMDVDSINAPVADVYIDSIIQIYRAPLQSQMEEVLAYSTQQMRKGTPEDLLNNFIADLVFDKGSAIYAPADGHPIDICILNYGGLRTSIPEGAVTQSRIFELMPFENEMVVVTMTPENAWNMFEYIASRNVGVPVSGIKLGVKDGKVADVLIQGKPYDSGKNYKVLTSDYLASSGDNMRFFRDPVATEILGLRIRDAIIMHLREAHQQGQMISSALDGRVYYKK